MVGETAEGQQQEIAKLKAALVVATAHLEHVRDVGVEYPRLAAEGVLADINFALDQSPATGHTKEGALQVLDMIRGHVAGCAEIVDMETRMGRNAINVRPDQKLGTAMTLGEDVFFLVRYRLK